MDQRAVRAGRRALLVHGAFALVCREREAIFEISNFDVTGEVVP